MKEYFAVLDEHERQGPFRSMRESIDILKRTSKARGHTKEEAQHFFLHQSAVEMEDTDGENMECIRLGWLAREEAGRDEELSPEDSFVILSHDEIDRSRENCLADVHFTVTARKAAEVNEGGLVDPKVP
jgi:hypothetical protein